MTIPNKLLCPQLRLQTRSIWHRNPVGFARLLYNGKLSFANTCSSIGATLSSAFETGSVPKGMLLMVASGVCFVCVAVLVRWVGTSLSAPQAAFIRYLFGTLMLAPIFFRLMRRQVRVNAPGMIVVRGVVHALAVILWFFAMARIPMAEVTAIGYLTPIVVTVAAAVVLGERIQARRLIAVAIGFVGVLVILRPGFQTLSVGQLAQLATTPLFAASFVLTKKLTETDSNTVIVAVLSLVCTLTLMVPAALNWMPVSLREYVLLFLTAGFATLGHFTLTHAFRCAPLAALQPVTYLQLVWATLLGVLIFDDAVDVYVVLGGAILVLSTTYIAHRESVLAKKEAADSL